MLRCQIAESPPVHSDADWFQLRAKHLPARQLLALARQALQSNKIVLVNSRLDVALAAGAHGLHLPSHSPPPQSFRALTPPGFLIGVSCHTHDEIRQAEDEGADYVFYSPIFSPASKPGYHPGLGTPALRLACSLTKLPVFALGGITVDNQAECADAGAAGVAGISLFSL
jgi:thiamine-phosphate pyrophosphorylase